MSVASLSLSFIFFELYVFVLLVFSASLLLIDRQAALMSKLAFLAARHSVAYCLLCCFVTCIHVTNKYDADDGDDDDDDDVTVEYG